VSLAGPASVSRDTGAFGRLERLARESDGGYRDALIEALAHARGERGSSALERLLSGPSDPATRAKVAEGLALHPESMALLSKLAADAVPRVRANAVWSLGVVGTAAVQELLEAKTKDPEAVVAGNAVAALGLLGARGAKVSPALCGFLTAGTAYARGNALAALSLLGARCRGDADLLATDASAIVRERAALLLQHAKSGSARERSMLRRCAAEDTRGTVAAACRSATTPFPKDSGAVLVYVVPPGTSGPGSSAPFALVRADGLTRLGFADRRGAVWEPQAPTGAVHLDVPAPFAD
jgi:HEAT repeat protein